MLKRALEVLGWLAALFIFIYASHAAFAHAPRVPGDAPPSAEARAGTRPE